MYICIFLLAHISRYIFYQAVVCKFLLQLIHHRKSGSRIVLICVINTYISRLYLLLYPYAIAPYQIRHLVEPGIDFQMVLSEDGSGTRIHCRLCFAIFFLYLFMFYFLDQKTVKEEEHVFCGLYNQSTPSFPP